MAYSTQSAVSDGTLVSLGITIEYFDRTEISVLFNDVLVAKGSGWDWVGTTDPTLSFTPAVPNLTEVTVVRATDISEIRHDLAGGAAYTDQTMDENFKQVLHIAQEAREGLQLGDIYQDLNMHGFRMINIADPVNPSDAMSYGAYQADVSGAFATAVATATASAEAAKANALAYAAGALVAKDLAEAAAVEATALIGGVVTVASNTAAPNATVPVSAITASNAATNVDAALLPKGSGSLLAAIPDSLSAGGNKRGTYATDWQRSRAGAAQVASGSGSVVAGGSNNTASGASSVVAGGSGNTSSGTNSYTDGSGNTAAGTLSRATGSSCTANGAYSEARGNSAYTATIGKAVAASATLAATVGGAQAGNLNLYGATTDATPKVLTSDAAAAIASNQLGMLNNSAVMIRGRVVCRQSVAQADKAAGFEFTACLTRGANAASTALVSAATVSILANNITGVTAGSVAVTADTTNGGAAITVTGVAATNLYWLATVDSTELVYA